MRENLYGVKIPDSIILRLEEASSPLDEGKKICEEIIQELIDLKRYIWCPSNGTELLEPVCRIDKIF